ncbi:MAG: phosphoglycerate dehydrogenase [Syntrophobacteraceae bacterium]|nr:phosphoglycerate dehydrogenase [Syntrophobacteraceae bacterium]
MGEGKRQTRALSECRVLVTPTTFGKEDPQLRSTLEKAVGEVIYNPMARPLSSSELLPLVKETDGCIAGLDQIDSSVIAAGSRLQVIARYGVGVDRVDVQAASKRGIVVTNTPGANSVAVAELAIALMLALGRQICQADQATRSGEWPRHSGVGLRGKTVGLVGFGAIGREVASRLKAFECRIVVVDPCVSSDCAGTYGVQLVPLEELLAASDFVSLHASLNSSTSGMVDDTFLKKMKQGAFVVNTARGELIDEEALRDALEKGHLRGAALDCFRKEPPGRDHPLLRLPRVIVTPHTGSHTDEATNTMGWMSLEACLAVLGGERPAHVVNPEVYQR